VRIRSGEWKERFKAVNTAPLPQLVVSIQKGSMIQSRAFFSKQEAFENRSAVLRMLRAFCFLVNSTHSYHLGISVGDIPDGRYETRQTFRSPITGGTKILFP